MRLRDALRLDRGCRLALVGAGGKTSALFCLGRDFQPPVLLTATTHLAQSQLALADLHVSLPDDVAIANLLSRLPDQRLLVTGYQVGEGRVAGVSRQDARSLADWAMRQGMPFLCEADGSRQKPLKAPAAHEPVIPDFATGVVVMAGLSGLGQPLSNEWVHRPERYASLSGLGLNDPISENALARVLSHPQGGLKDMPEPARRMVVLNQADIPERRAAARRMAPALLEAFEAIVVASLQPPSGDEPVIYAVYERTAGVILAAGESQRFGQAKALLAWRGEPFVRHIAGVALEAGLDPVVVVSGADHARIKAALEDLPVLVAPNPQWASGQSSSIKVGLQALPRQAGGAIFLLVDQPQVPVSALKALVERHTTSLSPIVAPGVAGRRANPVLFDRRTFAELKRLSGDIGGRALFGRYPVDLVPWDDAGLLLDVDTPEDYQRLAALYP